jgi:hypothetical protein
MTRLILTDEQANIVRQATGTISLLDPNGTIVAYVERLYTTAEVLSHLRSLEEEPPSSTGQFDGKFSRDETHVDR